MKRIKVGDNTAIQTKDPWAHSVGGSVNIKTGLILANEKKNLITSEVRDNRKAGNNCCHDKENMG